MQNAKCKMSDTFINVAITSDAEIAKLNRKHLGHEGPTDVLSFNLNETLPDGRFYLGDIIVSRDTAAKQALAAEIGRAHV